MASNYWASQSPVTDPGKSSYAINELASDLASIRDVTTKLIFHFRSPNFAKEGIPTSRVSEVELRYAETVLDVILSRGEASLIRDRPPIDRVVGCNRDAAVIFLAIARHKGIAARGRVGFAAYFEPGWFLDHIVAEVWDEAEQRWRLVDPYLKDSFQPQLNGKAVDLLDLKEDEFITGPRAWQAARAGKADPERFAVDSELDVPMLRSWCYLAHNLVLDLAFLRKTELLLWDSWGMQGRFKTGKIADADATVLDEVAATTSDPNIEPAVLEDLALREGLRVPRTVNSADANGGPTKEVDISRTLGL
jgi:hypothetical protein